MKSRKFNGETYWLEKIFPRVALLGSCADKRGFIREVSGREATPPRISGTTADRLRGKKRKNSQRLKSAII